MVLHNDISMASVSFVSMEGVVAEEASTRAAGDAGIIVVTFINSLCVCVTHGTLSLSFCWSVQCLMPGLLMLMFNLGRLTTPAPASDDLVATNTPVPWPADPSLVYFPVQCSCSSVSATPPPPTHALAPERGTTMYRKGTRLQT